MKRRWPWFAFGGVLIVTTALAITPPPDRFATFSDVGRPISYVDYNRLKRTEATETNITIDPSRTMQELDLRYGEQGWRIRAWTLSMSAHEAKMRLSSCDLPSRPIESYNDGAVYPRSGQDFRTWNYVSLMNDAAAEVMESTSLPKGYDCAVLVAESELQEDAWGRIVARLKRRLGLK